MKDNKIILNEMEDKNNSENRMVKNKNIKNIKKENTKNMTVFKILKHHQYNDLYRCKYTVSELKKLCHYYKQKTTGKKEELVKRMHDYLRNSHYVYKIQSVWKRKLIKQLIVSRGPGYKDREKCTNETDFYTMEDVKDIPARQFISFQDKEGGIYGFIILSIFNMILKTKLPLINPYNREEIHKNVIQHLYSIIKISKIFGVSLELQIEEPEHFTREKKAEMRALKLFQDMNDLGNYSEHKWLITLQKIQLIRFIKEIIDIWNYRAQLSQDVKREICPPYGNPFIDTNLFLLPRLETVELQELSLNLIDKLIN